MHLRDFMERLSRAVNVGAIISQDVPFGREYSWLWFTRRQVSESIIRFPRLKPLAGPERPFVKSQLLSTVILPFLGEVGIPSPAFDVSGPLDSPPLVSWASLAVASLAVGPCKNWMCKPS